MSSVNNVPNENLKNHPKEDGRTNKYYNNPDTAHSEIVQSTDLCSIIVDRDMDFCIRLQKCLSELFPHVYTMACIDDINNAKEEVLRNNYDLVFAEAQVIDTIHSLHHHLRSSKIISVSDNPIDAIMALRDDMCGFIFKPLDTEEVRISVQCALRKLKDLKRLETKLPHDKLFGIPTIEGMEFINTDEIVRCEGLQKCTRIITVERSDIVSSYNIGEFRKLFKGRGFFSCHKSHLINLKFVRKYSREGFIYFNANSKPVPLARRRKPEFLKMMHHL